jgi:hydroxylamine reductase
VLLSLLSLGFKNIRLGPTLPAFISANMLSILAENFGAAQAATAVEDIKSIMKSATAVEDIKSIMK